MRRGWKLGVFSFLVGLIVVEEIVVEGVLALGFGARVVRGVFGVLIGVGGGFKNTWRDVAGTRGGGLGGGWEFEDVGCGD